MFKVIRPWPRKSCPLCSVYSSGWILSIFGTNYHKHKKVCRMWWPLTLTYIFQVIRPWLWNRVRSITFSVQDQLFFWLGIQNDSIVWVIMMRRGYPQNAGVLVILVITTYQHRIPFNMYHRLSRFKSEKHFHKRIADLANSCTFRANFNGMYIWVTYYQPLLRSFSTASHQFGLVCIIVRIVLFGLIRTMWYLTYIVVGWFIYFAGMCWYIDPTAT